MSVSSRQSNRNRSAVRHKHISKVRGDASSRVPREDTDENDLQSRVVSHQNKQQIQTEPVSEIETKQTEESKTEIEQPVIKTPAEIFKAIHKEKQILQTLPKRKG